MRFLYNNLTKIVVKLEVQPMSPSAGFTLAVFFRKTWVFQENIGERDPALKALAVTMGSLVNAF
jgi:hypothetical protein